MTNSVAGEFIDIEAPEEDEGFVQMMIKTKQEEILLLPPLNKLKNKL